MTALLTDCASTFYSSEMIVAEVEVHQRWVLDNLLHQHSWKSLVSEFIDQFHPST